MGFAKKLNKTNAGSFTFKAGEDFQYHKLSELYDPKQPQRVITVRGCFLNPKSKFSKAVLYTDFDYVNLPKHEEKNIEEILNSQEAIDQINAGQLGFRIRTYQGQNGTNYSVDWVDLDGAAETHVTAGKDLPF